MHIFATAIPQQTSHAYNNNTSIRFQMPKGPLRNYFWVKSYDIRRIKAKKKKKNAFIINEFPKQVVSQ